MGAMMADTTRIAVHRAIDPNLYHILKSNYMRNNPMNPENSLSSQMGETSPVLAL